MNYRELLIKYMALIGHSEGIYYLADCYKDQSIFSPEEFDELCRLSAEADKLDLYNSLIAQR